MPQVKEQGQRGAKQKRECGQHGQPVNGLQFPDLEHTDQRSHDEGPGHQSRNIGVKDNQKSPERVRPRLVRVNVAFKPRQHLTMTLVTSLVIYQRTSLSMPA